MTTKQVLDEKIKKTFEKVLESDGLKTMIKLIMKMTPKEASEFNKYIKIVEKNTKDLTIAECEKKHTLSCSVCKKKTISECEKEHNCDECGEEIKTKVICEKCDERFKHE